MTISVGRYPTEQLKCYTLVFSVINTAITVSYLTVTATCLKTS